MDYNVNFDEEGDRLIGLFKELEEVIKNECRKTGIITDNKGISSLIDILSQKNSVVRKHKNELNLIRDVRNLNSHQGAKKYKYLVCPSPEINTKLENIINEIKNPPMIYDSKMCVKKQNMYCRNIDDSVYETIKTMSEKLYTHVPIFENNKLIGIFSENTLLDIVRLETGILLDENTNFYAIRDALKIENHSMESFEFISRRKNIYDVEDLFKNYFSSHKRVGCVYITENGRKEENILGMLTAWDVLGN